MPRRAATAVENNFIQGLITEKTALQFPPNACTDANNVFFSETGKVSRRKAIDLETGYAFNTVPETTNEVYVEYLWNAVAGSGARDFLVQQKGQTVYFFDVSTETAAVSPNINVFTIDLDDFKATGTSLNTKEQICQFASGNGDLIVVNRACDPFYVRYNPDDSSFATTTIQLKIRDFKGLSDGLELTVRPGETVSSLASNNPEHYYNILNQGWHAVDALSQWDSLRSDMPSNADVFFLFRGSATDAFDNSRVDANTYGNRPAPKGHFILDAFNPDRTAALTNDGFLSVTFSGSTTAISGATGTNIGNMTTNGGLAAAFDGDFSQTASESAVRNAANGYCGKNYTASPKRIAKAIIAGSSGNGYETGGTDAVTVSLYGKSTLPASGTDGTLLGSRSFTDKNTTNVKTIQNTVNTATAWNYVWVYITGTSSSSVIFAEVQFYTFNSSDPVDTVAERPQAVEFFNGRVFYAGTEAQEFTNNIYFTQIIERDEQYAQCYQKNDPTSEDFVDLLVDDGGVIRVPECGKVVKLFRIFQSLLVLATNGVWVIRGGADNAPFAANDYAVVKISSVGTDSPLSFVDIRGLPLWWSEDGIYRINFDPQSGNMSVENITNQTIKSFITDIKSLNRKYVKGAFDTSKNVIYWIYNNSASLVQTDYFKYNSILNLNVLSGAFFPHTFTGNPTIRGIRSITLSEGVANQIKLTTTVAIDASFTRLSFSENVSTTYKDWTAYKTFTGVAADEIDYTSYFITGYRIDGETQKFFQPNYVFVFLETESNASCKMQGIYDFSNSGNSGKWSTLQQLYTTALVYRDINFRRLKVRGKGRALQMRFTSESGKPFTIIGWSVFESANAAL